MSHLYLYSTLVIFLPLLLSSFYSVDPFCFPADSFKFYHPFNEDYLQKHGYLAGGYSTEEEELKKKQKTKPTNSPLPSFLSLSSPSIHREGWTLWISPPSMIGCCWTQCYADCVPVIADVRTMPLLEDSIIFYIQRNLEMDMSLVLIFFSHLFETGSGIPRLFSNLCYSWRWPWSSDPPVCLAKC